MGYTDGIFASYSGRSSQVSSRCGSKRSTLLFRRYSATVVRGRSGPSSPNVRGDRMRSTLFAALAASGLVAACTEAGGVAIDADLDKSSLEPKAVAPAPASDAGITVVAANWSKAGDAADCVSGSMAKAKPGVRVLPAKAFPNSIYRWDGGAIADLQRLVQQPSAQAEMAVGKVRYVVVVSVYTNNRTDDARDSPCTFTCGKHSNGSARVWDMTAGTEIAQASASASGRAVASRRRSSARSFRSGSIRTPSAPPARPSAPSWPNTSPARRRRRPPASEGCRHSPNSPSPRRGLASERLRRRAVHEGLPGPRPRHRSAGRH
jgi:hypothetical protein